MKDVFVIADNIVSPLGVTSAENFLRLTKSDSGIALHNRPSMSAQPFYASLISDTLLAGKSQGPPFTRFEQMLIASIRDALQQCKIDSSDPRMVCILSSTKGNISLLENETGEQTPYGRIGLPSSAALIREHIGFRHLPLMVSHACISGMLAIITGMRLIRAGRYDHAVIAGADTISRFVLSGFQSFQAISPEPCQPFDAKRKGITLGEAAATVILSAFPPKGRMALRIESGSVSNDANHISGPSRTGKELYFAIRAAMAEAAVSPDEIDFISAHGTATLYNDEMEANALNLAGLQSVPLNSLKGYYGHTLGAAGLVESVISLHSMKESLLIPTLGFEEAGTSQPVRVCTRVTAGSYQRCLKTASGFGGCNAAMLMSRE